MKWVYTTKTATTFLLNAYFETEASLKIDRLVRQYVMENTAMNNCGDTMNLATPEGNEDWLYNDDKVSEYWL